MQVKFPQDSVHRVAAVIVNGSLSLVPGFPRESHIPSVPTAAAAFWQWYR